MTIHRFWTGMSKPKLLLILLAMVIAGLDGIILSQLMSDVATFSRERQVSDLVQMIVYYIGFYWLIQIAQFVFSVLKNQLLKSLHTTYKLAIVQALEKEKEIDVAEKLSLLTVDLKLIEEKYFGVFFHFIYYTILGSVSLLYLVYLSPTLSLVFIICSLIPMLPSLLFSKVLSKSTDHYTKRNERFLRTVKDLFQGLAVIKTYQAMKVFNKRLAGVTDEVETSFEQLNNKHALVELISSIIDWFGYMIPISVALWFILEGKIEAGAVVALIMASDRVVYPFRAVSQYMRVTRSTKLTRDKVQAMLDRNQDNKEKMGASSCLVMKPDIIFQDVAFGYGLSPLFSYVNMEIPYGSKVLVTGASGSGKTTILDLIQGTLEPTKGQVLIGGTRHAASAIARIQQEPYFFDLTLRENLVMGLEQVTDEQLMTLLASVGLISELGEDCLNRRFGENGSQLSGGQRQRIEIARALLHNKTILLVDEGTSAIDKEASHQIRRLFLDLEATVIEVAHHFSPEIASRYSHHFHIHDKEIQLLAND